jgi:hypothetical protein
VPSVMHPLRAFCCAPPCSPMTEGGASEYPIWKMGSALIDANNRVMVIADAGLSSIQSLEVAACRLALKDFPHTGLSDRRIP